MNGYGVIATFCVLGVFLFVVGSNIFFKVNEPEYVLVLRFGQVTQVRQAPGIGVKMPFIDNVQRIDKRTLRADIPTREVPDKDKERMLISVVVRYEITDPLAFRKALRDEVTALDRLTTVIYSAMRDTVATKDRTEVIGAELMLDAEGNPVNDAEGLPVYVPLVDARDEITAEFQARVQRAAQEQNYGIQVISANIKRADFPLQVESAILERLRAERQRVAAGHRARGEEEYRQRTAAVQSEADILLAEARRDARRIRGEGDAESIAIIQEALTKNPEFYRFLRRLESYETTLTPGSLLVMEDVGGYFELLRNGPDE